jgi:hypothetical protein
MTVGVLVTGNACQRLTLDTLPVCLIRSLRSGINKIYSAMIRRGSASYSSVMDRSTIRTTCADNEFTASIAVATKVTPCILLRTASALHFPQQPCCCHSQYLHIISIAALTPPSECAPPSIHPSIRLSTHSSILPSIHRSVHLSHCFALRFACIAHSLSARASRLRTSHRLYICTRPLFHRTQLCASSRHVLRLET